MNKFLGGAVVILIVGGVIAIIGSAFGWLDPLGDNVSNLLSTLLGASIALGGTLALNRVNSSAEAHRRAILAEQNALREALGLLIDFDISFANFVRPRDQLIKAGSEWPSAPLDDPDRMAFGAIARRTWAACAGLREQLAQRCHSMLEQANDLSDGPRSVHSDDLAEYKNERKRRSEEFKMLVEEIAAEIRGLQIPDR